MKAILGDRTKLLMLGFAALMIATRYRHFGGVVALPDASLAVFLIGGFYVRRVSGFVLLLVLASLIDQAAVRWGGVSDWCVTPAYAFLVPAYGAAWLAGVWAASAFSPDARGALRVLAGFAAGTVSWFALSNAGFYWFSGHFGDMGAMDYVSRVLRYLPGYAATAGGYVLAAALLQAAVLAQSRSLRQA